MTQTPASHATVHGDPFLLRGVLLDLAIRSALLRIGRKYGDCPPYGSPEWEKGEHPLVKLDLSITADMRALGARLRDTGEDARANPLFASIDNACAYEVVFESQRRVTIVDLTPLAVYECLLRDNILVWQDWSVEVGEAFETEDGYGSPCFESRISVTSPIAGAEVATFSGVSKATARLIYTHMAGGRFDGVDTLGYDLPHPAEGVPSWAIRPDGSVDSDALESRWPRGDAREDCPDGEDLSAPAGGCGYTCAASYEEVVDAHHALAESDRPAWLARFDAKGRYYDEKTGFWASLNGEFRVRETGEWVPADE
jgi:hypothetical protein